MTGHLPSFELDIRITYADTDQMGVVYYSNYLVFFEQGRTELMRHLGVRYKDLEETEKVGLPVTEANCRYRAPARYDDLICVRTKIKRIGGVHMEFEYEVVNKETGQTLVEGFTRHVFVNEKWKPTPVPKSLLAKLHTD